MLYNSKSSDSNANQEEEIVDECASAIKEKSSGNGGKFYQIFIYFITFVLIFQ